MTDLIANTYTYHLLRY